MGFRPLSFVYDYYNIKMAAALYRAAQYQLRTEHIMGIHHGLIQLNKHVRI